MKPNLTLARNDRLMVLSVHPDDETLGAGGLLQQAVAAGAEIRVIFITDGDNNPWPQRLLEKRWTITPEDRRRWGRRRQEEALTALEVLGIGRECAVFLGLPDQGVTRLLIDEPEPVVTRLQDEIAAWFPTLLIVPSVQDTHPDHNAVAVFADLAMMRLAPSMPKPRLLSYLIHGREVFDTAAYEIGLAQHQLECKRQAILSHTTQVAFGRRRFLGYAKPHEKFLALPPSGVVQSRHPVQEVALEPQHLRVRVRMPYVLRRFGQPMLHVLAAHPQRLRHMDVALSGLQAGTLNRAGRLLKRAAIRLDDGVVETVLPTEPFVGMPDLYFKLERRWGFFDYAGWRPAAAQTVRQKIGVVGIIPCYNVGEFCEAVILQTLQVVDSLIVIDDGSADHTPGVLTKLYEAYPDRLSVITFAVNRGKGVGLMAGFCEALNRFDFDVLVTLDGDGQHPPAEIPKLVNAVAEGADMAIGGRELERMPARSKLGNTVVSSLLRWLYPHAPADTQSGLRAFNPQFTAEIVRQIRGSRYETEIQILLLALSQRREVTAVPIPTIYIDNNRSSKFRPVTDSIRILYALLGWELNHNRRIKP